MIPQWRGSESDQLSLKPGVQWETFVLVVIPQSPPPKDIKGVKLGGRTAISIPKRPPPKHRKTLLFMVHHKMEPPHDMGGILALRAHCALLLDYVPPEEPLGTPLANALRIR